eukprot:376209-Rhodomonas_salina.1
MARSGFWWAHADIMWRVLPLQCMGPGASIAPRLGGGSGKGHVVEGPGGPRPLPLSLALSFSMKSARGSLEGGPHVGS